MDSIFLIGGLVVLVLAIKAWERTSRLSGETRDLQRSLVDIADRLHALETAEARQRRPQHEAAPVADVAPAPSVPVTQAPERPDGQEGDDAERSGARELPTGAFDTGLPASPTPEPEPAAVFQTEPAAPNPVVAWLLRGNPLAKLGVVLMFFGLAYLLRFASERGWLPIELRLAGAAAISMALLAVGWRLRRRLPVYALTLQGGSIGALYLTSFAAFRVYSLLPSGLVFSLLVIICAASVALAVLQRAQSLAFLASLGGYLAPILLSTGGGNHVALFSYYTLLSAGILAVSFWQAWRPLNLIGFAFTFGVGLVWGAERYEPSMYGPTQILLAVNVLIYGVLAALAAVRRAGGTAEALVDGTLVFGTPLLGFGLQVGLTRHWKYGPAFSALAYGAAYLPLAWMTLHRWPERARRITVSFLALGGAFVTLAIPLALSAQWTSMAWAIEGLGILWVGRAQHSRRMVLGGTGLLVLAGASAGISWVNGLDTPTFFMVGSTLSLTWLAAGWMWSRDEQEGGFRLSPFLLAGGVIAWLIVIADGSDRLITGGASLMAALLGMSVTAWMWSGAASRAQWRALGECAFLLWPFVFFGLAGSGPPLEYGWWNLAWAPAFASAWRLLRWGRDAGTSRLRPVQHATFVWLAYWFAWAEVSWRLDRLGWGANEWRAAGLLTVSAACVLVLRQLGARSHWALTAYPRAYWMWGLAPAWITGTILLVRANLLDGRSPGWPYVPLVNPIELSAAFALLMGIAWQRELLRIVGPAAGILRLPLIAALVWWINGLLLRTLSTIGGVPWTSEALWRSAFLQTSMALAWTVAALICMAVAARRAHREAWFVGAGALGVVVVKLFLVDSARGGGLARAVAFIGVAALVLVIGYLAPLPPRAADEKEVAP